LFQLVAYGGGVQGTSGSGGATVPGASDVNYGFITSGITTEYSIGGKGGSYKDVEPMTGSLYSGSGGSCSASSNTGASDAGGPNGGGGKPIDGQTNGGPFLGEIAPNYFYIGGGGSGLNEQSVGGTYNAGNGTYGSGGGGGALYNDLTGNNYVYVNGGKGGDGYIIIYLQ
jgi:hypothetical protein